MDKENITELTEKDFDKFIAKGKCVVDFWAAWCSPCLYMEPHFEAAAKELKGKVKFGKVDVDKEQGLASRFQVMSIPTTIFFRDKEQVNRTTGAMNKERIIEEIKRNF